MIIKDRKTQRVLYMEDLSILQFPPGEVSLVLMPANVWDRKENAIKKIITSHINRAAEPYAKNVVFICSEEGKDPQEFIDRYDTFKESGIISLPISIDSISSELRAIEESSLEKGAPELIVHGLIIPSPQDLIYGPNYPRKCYESISLLKRIAMKYQIPVILCNTITEIDADQLKYNHWHGGFMLITDIMELCGMVILWDTKEES